MPNSSSFHPLIFSHQEEVFKSVIATARLFFDGKWRRLPIKPRFNLFISGPTGVGKTYLIRAVASELSLPMLELKASSWMPMGSSARGSRVTWPAIMDFCRDNKRGIIFLDEADKLYGFDDWASYIRVEIFSLLDRSPPAHVQFSPSDDDGLDPDTLAKNLRNLGLAEGRLQQSIFIIGAGAFQSMWRKREEKAIGFNPIKDEPKAELELKDMAQVVPPEIANRFISPVLSLQPLSRADYLCMIDELAPHLPRDLRKMFTAIGISCVDRAVEDQTGCRWIENILMRALLELHSPTKTQSVSPGQPSVEL